MNRFALGLSEPQASAVLNGTDLFLKACPGAGKTRSVAARAAMLASEGKALALLSYTRVGAAEIAEAILRDHGVPLTDQHFVGTLHSFLFRYVLRPFGHLITESPDAMSIDDDAISAGAPTGLRASEFEYGVDGQLRRIRKTMVRPDEVQEMAIARSAMARSGIVNFSDAISVSLQVLLRFPNVARALASRFDELIIDEAQDTNELLLACVRALKGAGLASLVLVGDYDQAIYEFNGSVPDGCQALADEAELDTRELRENFRSSQLICNMTTAIRGGTDPDIAAGPNSDLDVAPVVLLYEPGSHKDLPARFQALIEDTPAAIETSSVLVRKASFAAELSGLSRPSIPKPLKSLILAKSGRALTIEDYRSLEELILHRTFPGGRRPTGLDRTLIRARAVGLIASLPPLEGDLATWGSSAVELLDDVARELSPVTTNALAPVRPPQSWHGVDARVFIEEERSETEIATIHSVKGRSIDAVLLVAQVPEESYHTPNAAVWSAAVGGDRADMVEELRLAYVALTRASMLASVALPTNTKPAIVARWYEAGFRLDEGH
ncbi:UvrD-helicase domain-containing protein [Microbacterium sp. 2P01SA-2]|uniref:UvrD-helicase domain-containing protein n=1 Tax=unclassified Microbacterium TaxID=2609290 RepID=UPI0039A143C9